MTPKITASSQGLSFIQILMPWDLSQILPILKSKQGEKNVTVQVQGM